MRRALTSALLLAALTGTSCGGGEPVPPATELESVAIDFDGKRLAIVGGVAYLYDRDAKGWAFFRRLLEPGWFEKNYAVDGDRVFRIADDGKKIEVTRRFQSGFEDAATVRDLIGEKPGWTAFTLQSPRAPAVKDYVALRNRILREGAGFLDNVVEPSTARFHGGKAALRTKSVARSREMVCSKASLETELIHFRKGDDFWFSAWYYIEDRVPFTLMDLETTWIEEHPGIRITTSGAGLGFELKFPPKPHYRPTKPTPIPIGKWFRVVAHVKLDEKDGLCELWQDGVKVCEGRGQTLPIAEAICNSLEVGISATEVDSTVWVDDVEVSDREIK
ncbi:MAG: hypothetical protein HUU15_06295 [Candidatus Brocadiae bacterium]|nr:hypothetical protein [Candidatus Brocadiia bacterium]